MQLTRHTLSASSRTFSAVPQVEKPPRRTYIKGGNPNYAKKVQMPGVGKGNNPNSRKGIEMAREKKKKAAEERDPLLPTSVLMPTSVDDILDASMRRWYERDGEAEPEPLD